MTGEEFLQEWRSENEDITVFTSGSTGVPKRISLPKSFVAASARRSIDFFGLRPGDRIHTCVAFDYIGGKMTAVRSELADCLLTAEKPSNRPSLRGETVRGKHDDFAALPIKMVSAVPSQMPWLLEHLGELPAVEKWLIGGSAIPAPIRKAIVESGIEAWESYGMTETASHVALRRVGADATSPFTLLPGIEATTDARGCLVLRVPDTEGAVTEVVTNDLVTGITPDGSFTLLGRADDAINSGGKKFHPALGEAKVQPFFPYPFIFTAREDEKWGEHIVMLIETSETDPTRLDEIKTEAGEATAKTLEHWQQPKEILTVPALPRTPSGKLRRPRLPEYSFQGCTAQAKLNSQRQHR